MSVNTVMNGLRVYDPSSGEDRVQLQSSASTGDAFDMTFPLPTDGKYMFDAEIVVTTTGSTSEHGFATFRIHAGDEGLAWQRQNVDLTFSTTSTGTFYCTLGPFESAKVGHVATTASTAGVAVGDQAVKISYRGSTADGFPASSMASTEAVANIALFKLPEIEYTS